MKLNVDFSKRKVQLFTFLLSLSLTAWFTFMIWLTIATGIQHDHRFYIEFVSLGQESGNPYRLAKYVNGYGPLHQVFFLTAKYNLLMPKVISVIAFSTAVFAFCFFSRIKWGLTTLTSLVFLVLVNFSVICFVAIYGLNDSLIAALVLLAIVAKQSKRIGLAGTLLGMATLIKFYPLIIILLFAFHERSWDKKLLKYSFITTFSGNFISLLLWRQDYVVSVLSSIVRSSSLLSPLESLKSLSWNSSSNNPLLEILFSINQILIDLNIVFLFFAVVIFFYFAWRLNLSWLESSALGYLFILSVYKVGHPQFYIAWILILYALAVSPLISNFRLFVKLLPVVVFLQLYQIGFYLTNSYSESFQFLYYHAGWLYYMVLIFTAVRIFRNHNFLFTKS